MNTVRLRQQFIAGCTDLIQFKLDRALGRKSQLNMAYIDESHQADVWKALVPMLQQAKDPVPLAKLTAEEVSDKIDGVLAQVAAGELTIEDGKELMALIQAGFEVSDLQDLIAKLEEAGVINQ
jgi:hypothetical protein